MNNLELENILSIYPGFKGVFPADGLPNKSSCKHGCGYIANTDNANQPGTHWVGFFFPPRTQPEYFDSYGYLPICSGFYDFIPAGEFLYNNITLQAPMSNTCGQYCIFYLCCRFAGYSYNRIIKIFDEDNPTYNDNLVNDFVNNSFNTNYLVHNNDFLNCQISKLFTP